MSHPQKTNKKDRSNRSLSWGGRWWRPGSGDGRGWGKRRGLEPAGVIFGCVGQDTCTLAWAQSFLLHLWLHRPGCMQWARAEWKKSAIKTSSILGVWLSLHWCIECFKCFRLPEKDPVKTLQFYLLSFLTNGKLGSLACTAHHIFSWIELKIAPASGSKPSMGTSNQADYCSLPVLHKLWKTCSRVGVACLSSGCCKIILWTQEIKFPLLPFNCHILTKSRQMPWSWLALYASLCTMTLPQLFS